MLVFWYKNIGQPCHQHQARKATPYPQGESLSGRLLLGLWLLVEIRTLPGSGLHTSTIMFNQPGPRRSTVGIMIYKRQCCDHIPSNSGDRFGSAPGSRLYKPRIERHMQSHLHPRDNKHRQLTKRARLKGTGLRL